MIDHQLYLLYYHEKYDDSEAVVMKLIFRNIILNRNGNQGHPSDIQCENTD